MKPLLILSLHLLLSNFLFGQSSFTLDPIATDNVWIQYGIYLLKTEKSAKDKVTKIAEKEFPNLAIVDSVPNPDNELRPMILVESLQKASVRNVYKPPTPDYLEYFGYGLTREAVDKLQISQEVIVLHLFGPRDQIKSMLTDFNNLTTIIGETFDAVIWDEFTREAFSIDYWKKQRTVNPTESVIDISDHIVMHFYPENEKYCRLITLGMSKFGLPDIAIKDLSCYSGDEWVGLINLIAQILHQNPKLGMNNQLTVDINAIENQALKNRLSYSVKENGIGKASIPFFPAAPKSGDPENDILQVSFRPSKEMNVQMLQEELIRQVFGSKENEIVSIEAGNQALEKASKTAKEQLPRLKKLYKKGMENKQTLLMKFPFSYGVSDLDIEFMWIEVIDWKGDKIEGILQNEPYYTKGLKLGQQITRSTNDMYDYMLIFPDNSYEGNETGKILKSMESQK